jgi:hypothetical protein
MCQNYEAVFRKVQTVNPGNTYKRGRNCTEVLVVAAEEFEKNQSFWPPDILYGPFVTMNNYE